MELGERRLLVAFDQGQQGAMTVELGALERFAVGGDELLRLTERLVRGGKVAELRQLTGQPEEQLDRARPRIRLRTRGGGEPRDHDILLPEPAVVERIEQAGSRELRDQPYLLTPPGPPPLM
jgi:hypothetical protein